MSFCLSGQEMLALEDSPKLLEFWQWAFSDLKQNNVRGVFSEWLVARILGMKLDRCRQSWDAYDLITPSGMTLEVKSAAYLQSWHDESCKPSSIVFSGLKGQTWSLNSGYSGSQTYNADIYVFCLQTCQDPLVWDAFNLEQWRFASLERECMEGLNLKSLSLKRLMSLSGLLTVEALRQRFIEKGYLTSVSNSPEA
jgi:hypothetical protein